VHKRLTVKSVLKDILKEDSYLTAANLLYLCELKSGLKDILKEDSYLTEANLFYLCELKLEAIK